MHSKTVGDYLIDKGLINASIASTEDKVSVKCPFHEDRNSSGVLYGTGAYKCYAGGCVDFIRHYETDKLADELSRRGLDSSGIETNVNSNNYTSPPSAAPPAKTPHSFPKKLIKKLEPLTNKKTCEFKSNANKLRIEEKHDFIIPDRCINKKALELAKTRLSDDLRTIFIPINYRIEGGKEVSDSYVITRLDKPKNERYDMPKGTVTADCLVGLTAESQEVIKSANTVVLVEGFMDFLAWNSTSETPNALSLCTSNLGEYKAEKIKDLGVGEIILGLDNDDSGKKGTLKAIETLYSRGFSLHNLSFVNYRDCKDACDYIKKYNVLPKIVDFPNYLVNSYDIKNFSSAVTEFIESHMPDCLFKIRKALESDVKSALNKTDTNIVIENGKNFMKISELKKIAEDNIFDKIYTNVHVIDEMINVTIGSFVVFVAPSGHGKTTTLCNIAVGMMRNLNYGQLFLTLEEGELGIIKNLSDIINEVEKEDYQKDSSDEFGNVNKKRKLPPLNEDIYFEILDSSGSVTNAEVMELSVLSFCERCVSKNLTPVIYLDHFSAVDTGKRENKNSAIEYIVNALKKVTVKYKGIVFSTAQFAKGETGIKFNQIQANPETVLDPSNCIKDCSAISQTATHVIAIFQLYRTLSCQDKLMTLGIPWNSKLIKILKDRFGNAETARKINMVTEVNSLYYSGEYLPPNDYKYKTLFEKEGKKKQGYEIYNY